MIFGTKDDDGNDAVWVRVVKARIAQDRVQIGWETDWHQPAYRPDRSGEEMSPAGEPLRLIWSPCDDPEGRDLALGRWLREAIENGDHGLVGQLSRRIKQDVEATKALTEGGSRDCQLSRRIKQDVEGIAAPKRLAKWSAFLGVIEGTLEKGKRPNARAVRENMRDLTAKEQGKNLKDRSRKPGKKDKTKAEEYKDYTPTNFRRYLDGIGWSDLPETNSDPWPEVDP